MCAGRLVLKPPMSLAGIASIFFFFFLSDILARPLQISDRAGRLAKQGLQETLRFNSADFLGQ